MRETGGRRRFRVLRHPSTALGAVWGSGRELGAMMETTERPASGAAGTGRTDEELVRACATGDGGVAFTELVRRHGRAVLAVCRGLLGDGADADDAFQATFLVFLRRAGEVKRPAAVGGWLVGVASRVAGRVRQQRLRAWQRGTAVGAPNETANREPETTAAADPAAAALGAEERRAVWDGVAALPEKYRAVLLLCHLEERTTEEAAGALGCPVGTVRSRLLKARELLRAQLIRRGIALAVALLVLKEAGVAAAPSEELIRKTTASGGTSPAVERMVRDWGRGGFARRAWWGAAAGTALLLLLAGFGLTRPNEGERSPQPAPPAPVAQTSATGPGTLLVVSQRDSTVAFIDPSTGRTRATVATDPCPHEVAVSPDGRTAVVASYGLPFGKVHGGTVTLLDVAAGTKRATINLGAGSAPHGLAWLDDQRLLCTTEATGAVVEIDAVTERVTRTLRTDQMGTHMVVARGARAFTTNVHSATVSALDLNTGRKLRDREVGKAPEGIAVSPDGKRVWVGNRGDHTITVLAADDLSVLKVLRAPGMPLRLAFTPDGKTVIVTEIDSGELSFFDAAAMTETRRLTLSGGAFVFDTPGPPPGAAVVAFSADGKTAYCSMFFSKAVAVVDIATGTVTSKFDVAGDAIDGIAFSSVSAPE